MSPQLKDDQPDNNADMSGNTPQDVDVTNRAEMSRSWGSCLIAPTRTKNPISGKNGETYSIDMLRFELSHIVDVGRLHDLLDTTLGDCRLDWWTTNRIGGYRYMRRYKVPDASGIAVGTCPIAGNGKTDEHRGMVELNPNKVCTHAKKLLRMLVAHGVLVRPVRYDLAVDYGVPRSEVRMLKDTRKYGCEISNGMTEYLGQRSKPGRVKVYDKQAEADLDAPCTRVELTCDAAWTVEQVMQQLPTVITYHGVEGMSGVTRAYTAAVQALMRYGEQAEPWLQMLTSRHTRSKVRQALADPPALTYDRDAVAGIRSDVVRWALGWPHDGTVDGRLDAESEQRLLAYMRAGRIETEED